MASDYGNNFGFRVSDETRRSSMGRVKTPKTGSTLLQGTAVELDYTNPGYLKQAAANAVPRIGAAGLLVQEEVHIRDIYQPEVRDSFSLPYAKKNALSVITSGAGTKIWLKNTAGSTRIDGRVISAVSMFLGTNVAAGRGLAWNGTLFVDVADPTAATSWGEVVFYDASKGYLELVLSK